MAVLRLFILAFSLIVSQSSTIFVSAQSRLTGDGAAKIAAVFDTHSVVPLKCAIVAWSPSLDFDLRFVTGYEVRCSLGLFAGKKAYLMTYLRVIPQGMAPTFLGSAFQIPEAPPEMQQIARAPKKLKNEIEMSGVFCVGPGRYSVEVLVTDEQNRICRKSWRMRVAPHRDERHVQLAIQPLAVESIDQRSWPTVSSETRGRLRLTILVDAAPMNRYQLRLRAWDRAFLLECIYSLLRQTPHRAVRLVAFNLDHQREIFRADPFDSTAFLDLVRALEGVETASISVQALRKRDSAEFVAALTHKELVADPRPDAVIFLGANARLDVNISPGLFSVKKAGRPPLFYFEYFPWPGDNFPDVLQRLTTAADGGTFHFHSPAQFNQAIQKMLAQLIQD